MDITSLHDTIDLAKRDFSVILVDPRQVFLDWLERHIARNGLQDYRLYSPEQNVVLIIPHVDRFTEPDSLDAFLDELKPRLLAAEMTRFHIPPGELDGPPTAETFDTYFALSIRDAALFLSDLVPELVKS
jgi:hypothetical protein